MNHDAQASDWTAFHTPHSLRRQYVSEAIDRKPLLDRRSEPHPILNALIDEALTRIALVSDGGIMRLQQRITGTRSGDGAPSSDLAATIDKLAHGYVQCKTHRRRLEVIKEAQAEAVRLRYSPKSDILARGSKEWRMKIANDPRPQRVVAVDYRVSSKTITAARKEFPRNARGA